MPNFIFRYLDTYFDEVPAMEFYRNIFPVGELQSKGSKSDGKYNAIAVELLPDDDGLKTKKHIITDDLEVLEKIISGDNFTIISPISYVGKSRQSNNARYIYAICIDLDGITKEQHLIDLFYQFDMEVNPLPTYIVASGTGIHLYYQFINPIPCYSNIIKQLSNLKKDLTKRLWNKYTTELYDKPQIESLFQGFRAVGTVCKNKNYRTKAFEIGKKVDIEYLNKFVLEKNKVKEYQYKSKLSLEEAKRKYPEWYNKRIIEERPKGTWQCKRDLFDWWVKQIEYNATVGHRYYCLMVLSIYAKKCGIERKELEETAFKLLKPLDRMTKDENNHFTKEDIIASLEMYNDNYITFPINSIVSLTDIEIQKNKRNGRKQKLHLALARANKEILKEYGEMKPEGRPSKEKEVKEWRKKNPEGKKIDCIRQTGISDKTVYKYWNS